MLVLTDAQTQELNTLPKGMQGPYIENLLAISKRTTLQEMLFNYSADMSYVKQVEALRRVKPTKFSVGKGEVTKADQFATMLGMQSQLNILTSGEEWFKLNTPWYRAVYMETAEALDHIGWKWWKHRTPDIEQTHLELVDIWHFAMSVWLQEEYLHNSWLLADKAMLETLVTIFENAEPLEAPVENVEAFLSDVVNTKQVKFRLFANLCKSFGLSFEQLFVWYIGKNTLNTFRQNNGYADGSYKKQWPDEEGVLMDDNQHLALALGIFNPKVDTFAEVLYIYLETSYEQGTS